MSVAGGLSDHTRYLTRRFDEHNSAGYHKLAVEGATLTREAIASAERLFELSPTIEASCYVAKIVAHLDRLEEIWKPQMELAQASHEKVRGLMSNRRRTDAAFAAVCPPATSDRSKRPPLIAGQ